MTSLALAADIKRTRHTLSFAMISEYCYNERRNPHTHVNQLNGLQEPGQIMNKTNTAKTHEHYIYSDASVSLRRTTREGIRENKRGLNVSAKEYEQ